MMMKLICIVKGMTLQNPSPKAMAVSSGCTPMARVQAATTITAASAKA